MRSAHFVLFFKQKAFSSFCKILIFFVLINFLRWNSACWLKFLNLWLMCERFVYYHVVCNLMTTQSDCTKLIDLLDKAEKQASEFQGGYSGQFLSAQEFHQALLDGINKLKQGDKTQLGKLHIWFLPTSCWDDFIGKDGQDLANEIGRLLSTLTKA